MHTVLSQAVVGTKCRQIIAALRCAQGNLQQQKRSEQEVDYMLMHRLLSPVQSAILILQARTCSAHHGFLD